MRYMYRYAIRGSKSRWHPFALACVAALLALFAMPRHVAAQTYTTPRVRISPTGGAYARGATVTASVQYCSRYAFLSGSEKLTLNGQPVSFTGTTTTSGTQSDCPLNHVQFERRNIVLLLDYGNNLFKASIENDLDGNPATDDGFYRQVSAQYETPYPNYGVMLVADNRYVDARASTSRVERYRITNTGDVSTLFAITCTWSPGTGCTLSRDTITLMKDSAATVTATITVGAAGSVATLGLNASGGGGSFPAKASVITEITAVAAPSATRGVTLVNPTGLVERDLCVTIKAGNDAAAECGDLRLAHALPSMRTKGKVRTPVLLYNSALADPRVIIPANVALGAGFNSAATLTARVVLTSPASRAGQQYDAGQWAASDWPSNGELRRIAASFGGDTLPSGIYGYRLEIRRSTDAVVDTASGVLLQVNRSRSSLGAGWWLAGQQQVIPLSTNEYMWIGGDGSARRYLSVGSCDWRAEQVDRADRFDCEPNGWLVKLLPNRLRVSFDSIGRHRYTVNRFGDTTEFKYNTQSQLTEILLPPRINGVAAASYTFHYNAASGLLDSVSAPPLSASKPRRLKVASVTGRPMIGGSSGGRILSLRDPDSTLVQLHYANESAGQGEYRPTSRVDRRGTTTTFIWGSGMKLASASTPASASQTVVQAFRAAEALGIGVASPAGVQAVSLDSIYSSLDGPRTDVSDVSKWWVNRLGAPIRVRDPMGVESKVTYDATWAGLASITRGSTGLESRAWYSARALVDSTKSLNPFGNGQDAVTRYFWNGTWDMPDSTKAPTGEVSSRGYDANGNVLWEQAGRDSARRVNFGYHAATKQLTSVRYPLLATPDTIEYDDVLQNVAKTTSPGGRWVQHVTDAIGRDTLIESPIDATGKNARQRISYDIADQVKESRTEGPAMPYTLAGTASGTQVDTAAVLPETLVVRTTYDAEGNVTRLQKLALPNPRPWINRCDAPRGQCQGIVAEDTGSVDVRTYDKLHRVLTTRLGSSGGTNTYDPAGNVLTHKSWNNRITSAIYDAANRRTKTIVPEVSYPRETCEAMTYGPLYRPTPATCGLRFPYYPNSNAIDLLIPADTARFTFDQAGQLRGAFNALTAVTRSYLPSGAIGTDTLRLRDYIGASLALKYGLGYVYDLSGRRVTLRTPWAADSVRYAYDTSASSGTGALLTVMQGNAKLRFTYDLAGRQDSLFIGTSTATGVTEVRRYDDDGMLRRRIRTSAAIGNLLSDTIVYDLRDKMLDVYTASAASDAGSTEYHNRYSALGAVLAQQKMRDASHWDLEEFRTTGMGDVYRSRTFHSAGDNDFPTYSTYNQFGALIARGPDRDLSIPNAQNSSDTTYTIVDDAGNVNWTGTYRRPWQMAGGESQSITRSYYAADNKLRFQQVYSVPNNSAGPNDPPPPQKGSWEEHWYDALGRKVLTRARRDTLCTPTTNDPCSSYIERTVWDGDQLLYELRGQGGNGASDYLLNSDVASGYDYGKVGYVHAGGIDAPLVLMDGRVPNYNWRGLPESSVWLSGAAADCAIATGTCTTIRWPGNQGVYMKPGGPGASTSSNPAQWVGSLMANGVGSTGMAYRRNRFYDGATGQFNQQDPIGLGGGANTYGFTGGDPVSYSDPFGLCPQHLQWGSLKSIACSFIEAGAMALGSGGGAVVGGIVGAPSGPGAVLTMAGGAAIGAGIGLAAGQSITNTLFAESSEGSGSRSSERSLGDKISTGHAWDEHGGQFAELGVKNRSQFGRFIDRVVANARGPNVRALEDGRSAYFDPRTRTVVIQDPRSADGGTAFRSSLRYFQNLQ